MNDFDARKDGILILSDDPINICTICSELYMMELEYTVSKEWRFDLSPRLLILDVDYYVDRRPRLGESELTLGIIKSKELFASGRLGTDVINRCNTILSHPFSLKDLRHAINQLYKNNPDIIDNKDIDYGLPIPCDNGTSAIYHGVNLQLSPNEMIVLRELSANQGMPVSRERLANLIGGASSNKVDVYICLLRKKLEEISPRKILHSVRGVGYMLK